MKISFPKQDSSAIIANIKKTMGDRSLSKIVDLNNDSSGNIVIQIKKLGTSTLSFTRKDDGGNATFALTEEKIAFAHRAFKDEVTEKIVQVIEQSGGKVS